MATPRRYTTIAMLDAEQATKRALEAAVAEHERQVAAEENAQIGGYLGRYKPYAAGLASKGLAATPTPNMSPKPQPTADQQALVDAIGDENDRWTARDERGRTVSTAKRIDLPNMGRGLSRDVANVEADDKRRAAEAEKIRARSKPNPARRA